jgi:hypothetical protein
MIASPESRRKERQMIVSPKTVGASASNTISATQRPAAPEAGTLVIVDHFQGAEAGTKLSHGELAARAAAQVGFQGTVQKLELPAYEHATVEAGQLNASTLDESTVTDDVGRLNSVTSVLNQVADSGLQDGAVSLSQGLSKAKSVETLYLQARAAWDPKASSDARERALEVLPDYARMFQLEAGQMTSSNPEVSADERAAFQQKLIDQVSQSMDHSSEFQLARANYCQATARLDQSRVSVVVAAENCGTLLSTMEADAGGKQPSLPKDFFDNGLSDAHTLTVGAAASDSVWGSSEHIASYSSPSPQVGLVADGEVSFGVLGLGGKAWGTSCSAPKVAAVLAQIHHDCPSTSDTEAEARLKTELTQPIPSQNGTIALLTDGKARSFLKR